jgi:hypothetical protein
MYQAFISYAHQDDRERRLSGESECVRWAEWLYNKLMEFRTPQAIIGKENRYGDRVPERTWPIFRDTNELPTSSSLASSIKQALHDSKVLIVLCSSRASRSLYVGEEIREFKSIGRGDRILAVILEGVPNATRKGVEEKECFPAALRFGIDSQGAIDLSQPLEPIAADFRDPETGSEIKANSFAAQEKRLEIELKRVIAGIIGVPFAKLVDWEVLAKEEKAAELLGRSGHFLEMVLSTSPDTNYESALENLIKSERFAERALATAPPQSNEHSRAARSVAQRRHSIFELALENNDLGLAQYYLSRNGDGNVPPGHGRKEWASLNAAWDRTDPARSKTLQNAFLAALVLPALAVIGSAAMFLLSQSALIKVISLLGSIALCIGSAVILHGVHHLLNSNQRGHAVTWRRIYVHFSRY